MAAAKLCVVDSVQGRAKVVGVHNYEPFADIGDEKPSRSYVEKILLLMVCHAVEVLSRCKASAMYRSLTFSGIFGFRPQNLRIADASQSLGVNNVFEPFSRMFVSLE